MVLTRRRVLSASAILLALGVAGLLLLRSSAVERVAADLLAWEISRRTGEDAVVGELSFDLLDAAVRVDGLVLSHVSEDPERDGATILAVSRVTVRPGLGGLGRVELERPDVRLHLDGRGLREFQGLAGGSETAGDGAPPQHLPWRALHVVDGAFTLEADGNTVRLVGVDVRPAVPGT